LVEEAETQEQSSKEPKKAVGVDLGITRLVTLFDGRVLQNPKPLERSFERIRVLQSLKKKVSFQKLA
jgi:transposase